MCCPDARWRRPYSSLAASNPPLARTGAGVRVPQVPHITPQLRPPVQPKASQHAASWPPVDAGRLNVTHIIIHHREELGRGRRGWRAGVRERGPGPDSFCPGQLKSLQPPLWTYSTSPHQVLNPPSAVMDKKQTSTRAWRAQAALGGLVRDEETWIKDEELRVLGHCFHLTGMRCTWLLSLSSNFVYIWKGVMLSDVPPLHSWLWGWLVNSKLEQMPGRLQALFGALAAGQICHGRLVHRSSPDLWVFKLP